MFRGAPSQRFDDEVVEFDASVFNAGRIVKLYGTVAKKGDNVSVAPWRLSRERVVPVEKLRELASAAIATTQPRGAGSTRFSLEEFLSRLDIEYQRDVHEGGERFKLDHCPFNPEHGRGEAAIFRMADGRLGFKCQHNSCADRNGSNCENSWMGQDKGEQRV